MVYIYRPSFGDKDHDRSCMNHKRCFSGLGIEIQFRPVESDESHSDGCAARGKAIQRVYLL
jgi:hypothetical protein